MAYVSGARSYGFLPSVHPYYGFLATNTQPCLEIPSEQHFVTYSIFDLVSHCISALYFIGCTA